VTVQVHARAAPVKAQIKLRQNVSQMSGDEVARFRAAMKQFIERPDNKGFEFFANWHGVAFGICKHHEELFLPWHRGYLYLFELALQDIDAEVTLPWWNWMDEAGIPNAYEEGGADNVLRKAPIKPWGGETREGWPTETNRDPGGPKPEGPAPWPPPVRSGEIAGKQVNLYDWMMKASSYREFNERCWRLHDNVHVWVGGTMEDQDWAAYDPIFWAHHAMVDRLWRIWQHANPSALMDRGLLETPMTFASEPSMTVRQVQDVTQLGYDYAGQVASSPGPA
jgi:tyrosinase